MPEATQESTVNASEKVKARQAALKQKREAKKAEKAEKSQQAAVVNKRQVSITSQAPVTDLPCPACKNRTRYLKHATWCSKNPENNLR